jgi:Fic family protein
LFVPPPVNELENCLSSFELFLHDENPRLPSLIKAGLLHVQFETIHPFLDGNGRVGRLLVTLFLCQQGVLQQPLLYLSLYFKTHRADYYRLLQEVREHGAWEAWLEFFLTGVGETANQAFDAANNIVSVFARDRERITTVGDRTSSALRVHDALKKMPFASASKLAASTMLTLPTINAALAELERLEIVEEVTGKQRGRIFGYREYLDILNEGAMPIT